jgi:hypothetical protein
MFNNFLFENYTVYGIMWKNTLELDRPQTTTWRMHIACWIPKATNTHTHRLCDTHCFSTVTVVARTRLYVTLHAHCLHCSFWYEKQADENKYGALMESYRQAKTEVREISDPITLCTQKSHTD